MRLRKYAFIDKCFIFLQDLCKTILEMFLAFLVPIINIGIILVFRADSRADVYNMYNIIFATNACYMATLDRLFKVRTEFNNWYIYIKNVGLILSITMFTLTTVFIRINTIQLINENLNILSSLLITIISIILGIFSQKEATKVSELVDRGLVKRANTIIRDSASLKNIPIKGSMYDIGGKKDE